MQRPARILSLVLALTGATATAQTKAFDVASIKLNNFGATTPQNPPRSNMDLDPGDLFVPTGGVFSARNKSLRTLIAFAYKMSGDQQNFLKLNVPDFVLTERFDVEARTTETQATKDDYRAMMATLLAERFALKVHRETRASKVYALILTAPGKLGTAIRPHPADDTLCSNPGPISKMSMPADGFPPLCGIILGMPPRNPSTDAKGALAIGGRNVPMPLVASSLVNDGDTGLKFPVVDKTGITTNVDFTLQLGYDEMEATNTPNTAPYFVQALKDQLGMKLRQEQGTIDVYIVDHVEHLHEN